MFQKSSILSYLSYFYRIKIDVLSIRWEFRDGVCNGGYVLVEILATRLYLSGAFGFHVSTVNPFFLNYAINLLSTYV
jgi:hypothetical protein